MQYGSQEIKRGDKGEDVQDLHIRLAAFRGTVPDGDFGPGSELQVITFQRDFMKLQQPTGLVDRKTMAAIDRFADRYPINFRQLACPCRQCGGFGQQKFKGKYRSGKPKLEMFYRYEYPGVHRMLLWAVRGLFLYMPEHKFVINSGYRCSVHNQQKGRESTNHHGKAIDLDVVGKRGEDRRDDMNRCEKIRGRLVELSNAQIGWAAANRKALEPSNIAPTWVHYDVRCYERKYLAGSFFCQNLKDLNRKLPISF